MNKHIALLVILIILSSCNSTETEVDGEFVIEKKTDLIGVWKYEPICFFPMPCVGSPYYLIIDHDSSFFLNTIVYENTSAVALMSFEIEVEVGKTNEFSLSPNFDRIKESISYGAIPQYTQIHKNVLGYDSVRVFSYSNIDSLKRTAVLADSLGVETDEELGEIEKVSYKLISSSGTIELQMLESECYKKNPTFNEYSGVCRIYNFIKQPDFNIDILHAITPYTLSSSDNWRYVLDDYPELYPNYIIEE